MAFCNQEVFIRIIELPRIRMVRSGDSDLETFDRWWSAIADKDEYSLFPRDFMWLNKKTGTLEWLYALPAAVKDSGGYDVFDFPGGLYAVVACRDEDREIQKTNKIIHDQVKQSKIFEEDETNTRYDMGHVITPKDAKKTMRYHQMDLFVPIVLRKHEK